MRWPWKKAKPAEPVCVDEWLVVPFRFAEAARLSVYTIAHQEQVPQDVRMWIASWLYEYNTELALYMRETYGPEIFPLLDRITSEVWPNGETALAGGEEDTQPMPGVVEETWERWEQELQGGQQHE